MSPSGTALVHYFERDQPVGTRQMHCCGYLSASGQRSSGYWPNTAYFCPCCGELWGRAIYDHQYDYQPFVATSWVIETRRCAEHGDGSFLSGYNAEHLPFCSHELLKREATILCLHNLTKE